MHFCRTAGAAVALGVVAALAPATVAAASVTTHNAADVGLFGASDPSYDGVFRQSLGLLAEQAAGVNDSAAVGWLVRQQCPDGGWTPYRSDLSKPCPATDLTAFTGEDSNSTALALEALHAVGVTPKHDGLAFLHALQDSDGGFPLLAGSGTDPNSTALVVQSLHAVGQDPTGAAWTTGGHTPLDALMASWLGCGSADPGAFSSPYSSGHGDLVATVQSVWGVEQQAFPFTSSASAGQPSPDCSGAPPAPTPQQAGQYAATWLAGRMSSTGSFSTGSSPDYSLTAEAALAMAASGTNGAALTKAVDYLSAHAHTAVLDAHGNVSPGAVGYLALAAHATGRSLRSFGGVDLVQTLASSRRALPAEPHRVTRPATHPVTGPVQRPVAATPPAVGASTLPRTGSPLQVESGVAIDCLFVGALLVLAGRRRRSARS